MKNGKKFDISLLKKLMVELDQTINAVNEAQVNDNKDELYIALSKSSGIAAGVAQEAVILISNIYATMQERETIETMPQKQGSIFEIFGSSSPKGGRNKN